MRYAAFRMNSAAVNALDRAAFEAAFGPVFEHAPWVAAAAWDARPFPDADALHQACIAVLAAAPAERRLAFLNAHPELGAAAEIVDTLTLESRDEQMSAGLTSLTPGEAAWFAAMNRRYRARFGFPFIIAVRRCTKAGIVAAFERRLDGGAACEIDRAFEEIGWIARLRLDDRLRSLGWLEGA